MHLIEHVLTDYRNIETLRFQPGQGVSVIGGENGQGKTNLLESIFLLTGARSFRGGRDASLIQQGQNFAVIESAFFSDERPQKIRLTISDKGRVASLNGGGEMKAAGLVGKLCCVVFSPEHLELVKGSPETRRRFLDTALCQISPTYLSNLRRTTRLTAQRNSLLKEAQYVSAASEMLDVYDAQFVQTSCVVTEQRRRFAGELLPLARRYYDAISGGREDINFRYRSTLFAQGEADYDEGLANLMAARSDDLRAGFSTLGPHRDDLVLTLDGQDARVFASQGQQRCIVLALKLAEAELMEIRLQERPLLLLDDVLSELDAARQEFLIGSIADNQAIITCCAPELVAARTDAEVFVMEAGRLSCH